MPQVRGLACRLGRCFCFANLIAAKTAKESGVVSVGVYDKSSEDLVEAIKAVTDKYIYDFSEIL